MPHNQTDGLIIAKRWRILQIALLTAGAATLLMPAQYTSAPPLNRHWGWDQLLYLPPVLALVLAIVLVLSLFPKAHYILCKPNFITNTLIKTNKHKWYFLASGLLAVLFWQFRVKYYFLGDFDIRMKQCISGDYVSTEYCTMWLLNKVYGFGSQLGAKPETTFKLYSVVAGFFFVYLSFLTASELSHKKEGSKLVYWCALVFTAQLLLFCGYVEIYATPSVMLLLFVYTSSRYFNNRSGKFTLVFVYVLALAAHLLSIAALPALLIVLFDTQLKTLRLKYTLSQTKTIIGVLVFALLACVLLFAKGHHFLMPLKVPSDNPERMTLLSLKHCWEFFNGQVLCSSIAVLIIPYLLVRATKKNVILSRTSNFFLMYSLGMFLLCFVSDLQRGSGDWDIMSFTAMPFTLAMISLCYDIFHTQSLIFRQIIFPNLSFNLVSAIAWIGIQHTDLSIAKITDMLQADPASYYNARLTSETQLAICFQNNNLPKAAELMAGKACGNSEKEDVTPCLIYARCLVNSGRLPEAAVFIEDLILHRSPYYYEAYLILLPYLENTGQDEKTIFYVEKMYLAFVERPKLFLYSANFNAEALSGLFSELYTIKRSTWSEANQQQLLEQIQFIKQWRPQTK